MIEMKNLGKTYGNKENATVALDHINLTVKQGEFVAIMGKSGAGKSTLLHILGGLDTFDSGEYHLMGKNVGAMKDSALSRLRNETIGFVMQDFALISEKTVLFNTMLPLFFDKTPWSQMKAQGLAALERVGIQELAKKRVNQLSGGQKQRVAIARAIVKDPLLLLADEPTGSLDSETGKSIMEILTALNGQGTTIVLVTHDEDVAACCKRKIFLSDGKVVQDFSRQT